MSNKINENSSYMQNNNIKNLKIMKNTAFKTTAKATVSKDSKK